MIELEWSFDPSEFQAGNLTVDAIGTDAAGNSYTDSIEVEVVPPLTGVVTPAALDAAATATVTGGGAGEQAGAAVATLGDLNNDGIAEVAIGSPKADSSNRVDAGVVRIVDGAALDGSVSLSSPTAVLATITGAQLLSRAGSAVANAGDVDGDGNDDLLVGAPGPVALQGRVYVLFGHALTTTIDLSAIGAAGFEIVGPLPALGVLPSAAKFGSALPPHDPVGAEQDDFNGDGLADVIVSSPSDRLVDGVFGGSAYVIWGKTSATPVQMATLGNGGMILRGPADANSRFGAAAGHVGDVNGDGLGDLAVGDPAAAPGGIAYVVFGTATPPASVTLGPTFPQSPSTGMRIEAETGAELGTSLAAVGDADGDGFADFALGGRRPALVFGQDGMDVMRLSDREPLDAISFDPPAGRSGAAVVAGGGDFNGDALDDVVLAFPGSATESGAVFTIRPSEGLDIPAIVALDQLSPQLGSRFDGAVAEKAGAALATYSSEPGGAAELLIGQPLRTSGTNVASGAVLRTPGIASDGQSLLEAEASRSCAKKGVPYTYDRGGDAPSCRLTLRGNQERAFKVTRGYKNAFRKLPKEYRESRRNQGGNARLEFARGSLKSGRWPLVDSLDNPIGFIEPSGKDDFKLYGVNEGFLGNTKNVGPEQRRPARFTMEGRGCMSSVGLEDDNMLVYLLAGQDGPNVLEVRGFLPRAAVKANAFDRNIANDRLIDAYYIPCGKKRGYAMISEPDVRQAPDFQPGELYQGDNAAEGCEDDPERFPGGQFDPNCGTPFLNYKWQQYPSDPPGNNFANFVVLTAYTTGISPGGGITRALVTTPSSVTVRDRIGYVDPNVPCLSPGRVSWDYVQVGGRIFMWWPRKQVSSETRMSPGCQQRPGQR